MWFRNFTENHLPHGAVCIVLKPKTCTGHSKQACCCYYQPYNSALVRKTIIMKELKHLSK